MPEVYTLIADGDTDPESIIDAPLMTALNKNLLAAFEGASGAPRLTRPALASNVLLKWLYDFGNGSDGAVTKTVTGTIAPGLYQHTTFAINNGVVITPSVRGPIIIMAQTSITITGTLSVDGMGGVGGLAHNTVGGQCGGDGIYGGSGGAGVNGGGGNGGNGGRTFANAGGLVSASAGAAQSTRTQDTLLALMTGIMSSASPSTSKTSAQGPDTIAQSAAGGGGGGGSGNIISHDGGNGGGLIVLIAPIITINATGILTADGANGVTGGGGGGGGAIIIATPSGGYTNNGSVAATAGTSSGAGAGGAGWVRNFII